MEIKQTKDYEKFKFIEGNRKIDIAHVSKLRESFRQNNLCSVKPIVVNSKMEIIDGQHSFVALKELGYPIYYIQGNGLGINDVQALNSCSSNWKGVDFVNMHVLAGNRNYKILYDFLENWTLPFSVSVELLSKGKAVNKNTIKSGDFIIVNKEYADKVAKQLHDFSPYTNDFKKSSFIKAFIRVSDMRGYSHSHMVKQLAAYGKKMPTGTAWPIWVDIFDVIYNYKMPTKLNFKNQIKDYLFQKAK